MNTLQSSLINQIKQIISSNKPVNGTSLYLLSHQSSQHQMDESSVHSVIFSGNPSGDHSGTESQNSINNIEQQILSLDINHISDNFEPFNLLYSSSNKKLWISTAEDSVYLCITDNTIYINIIESGQY